jgi:hypothetical protein
MHHRVICSRCNVRFSRGVTRVRRFVVFHFCAYCHRNRRGECDSIMTKVTEFPGPDNRERAQSAGPLSMGRGSAHA